MERPWPPSDLWTVGILSPSNMTVLSLIGVMTTTQRLVRHLLKSHYLFLPLNHECRDLWCRVVPTSSLFVLVWDSSEGHGGLLLPPPGGTLVIPTRVDPEVRGRGSL